MKVNKQYMKDHLYDLLIEYPSDTWRAIDEFFEEYEEYINEIPTYNSDIPELNEIEHFKETLKLLGNLLTDLYNNKLMDKDIYNDIDKIKDIVEDINLHPMIIILELLNGGK